MGKTGLGSCIKYFLQAFFVILFGNFFCLKNLRFNSSSDVKGLLPKYLKWGWYNPILLTAVEEEIYFSKKKTFSKKKQALKILMWDW